MSLLPTFIADDEELIEEYTEELPEPREYEIDMKTGQLTGRIVTGIEAIKMWVYLAINTPRYKYTIFTWNYGNESEDLIGSRYSHEVTESEAQRMIEECLLVCPYITEVNDFECTFRGSTLTINFSVITDYGEFEQEVIIDDI